MNARHLSLPLLLLLAACSTSPKAPEWVSADSAAYPAARYLVGRGQADSSALAGDRARAELAKAFGVRIEQTSRDSVAYNRKPGATATTATVQAEARREIRTASEHWLEGIEIVERWQDPQTGSHHALAVLSRVHAGIELRRRIAELDAATGAHLQRARTMSDPLGQLAAAQAALTTQQARAAAQRRLAVVDPNAAGGAPPWPLARLESDLEGLIARLSLAPQAAPDSLPELGPLLSAAIARAGFRPDPAAGYRLTGDLRLDSPITAADGWHWVRGRLELTLTDAADRVLGRHAWPVKSAAPAPALARQRALEEAAQHLQHELREVVLGFAARPVE